MQLCKLVSVLHNCLEFSQPLSCLFSSGIVEQAKLEGVRKSPHARKGDTASRFLPRGDFHARSRFARSIVPEDKWGTTRSLKGMQTRKTSSIA